MKILLTGGTGFLGSKCLKALIQNGHDVSILKRSSSSLERIKEFTGQYKAIDIDCSQVEDVFSRNQFDVVIHCAVAYGRAGEHSAKVFETNYMFPIKLLETAIACECPYFINTDTFFCKQLPGRLERKEDIYMPEYTFSKYQFREWGRQRGNEGKITFVNLQLEHVYGEGDSLNKFIPWITKQLKENVPYIDLTDGIQLRDFVCVDSVVKVYMNVLKNLEEHRITGGYFNYSVGTGQSMSVRSFIEHLKEQIGSSTELRFGVILRKPSEIMYSTADSRSMY